MCLFHMYKELYFIKDSSRDARLPHHVAFTQEEY
ncbi:unnamed protein product [Chondrus crispus]|uniref:Uncharacterized protein n=1 Tax=Chondrus crispus TaxID=2769 RepID=R7Q4G8_CHOCR|nr:unnamed protein product [Chondrus crispus]XP_005711922.1 unnamed protein product [Chondrus crispus]CDF32256.1 unnamed protein product [Chondrus crispus]CDF32257.1 unnamed protein product [Chondrus crispus]|eukprot:XP_005711921.1 unnamed protein product [Chondrus crispus]